MVSIIKAENISYSYNEERKIFENVSLELFKGQILSVIGPNGAGKSTLLNCLSGTQNPTSGVIYIDGKKLSEMSNRAVSKKVGYVQQNENPVFGYSVRNYVVMGRAPYISTIRMPSSKDFRIVDETIEKLGIQHLAMRPYTELSGGERQQVSIAKAIVQQPELIIMDEPTSALDFGNQMKTLKMIKELAQSGYGIIMTTHNPDHAVLLGGQVGILDKSGQFRIGQTSDMLTSQTLSELYKTEVCVSYVDDVQRRACMTKI